MDDRGVRVHHVGAFPLHDPPERARHERIRERRVERPAGALVHAGPLHQAAHAMDPHALVELERRRARHLGRRDADGMAAIGERPREAGDMPFGAADHGCVEIGEQEDPASAHAVHLPGSFVPFWNHSVTEPTGAGAPVSCTDTRRR